MHNLVDTTEKIEREKNRKGEKRIKRRRYRDRNRALQGAIWGGCDRIQGISRKMKRKGVV